MLHYRVLAGYDVPNFYEYVKEGKIVKGNPIELTEEQWTEYDNDFKGVLDGAKAIMVFEDGMMKILPIKTAFLGGVTNKPEEKKITPFQSGHDATKAQGGDPEKAATDVKDGVEDGDRKTDTKDIKESDEMDETAGNNVKTQEDSNEKSNCAQCGKQFGGNKQINTCADHQNMEVANESAEEKAKKLIKSVRSGNRITDTSETDTDSNTTVDKTKTQLGTEKFKTVDQADDQADDPKKINPEMPTSEPDATKSQGGNPVTERKSLKAYLNKIVEKWGTSYETPKSKKGMFDGKSQEELHAELNGLKKSGPHKEGSPEFTKEKELDFALRAKNKFGKVAENAHNEKDANKELAKSKKKENNDYFGHNEKATKKKVKESAEDIAKKIIATVKGGNHPHDAKNSGDPEEEKGKSFDYNKLVDNTPEVDAARDGDATETETRDEKRGLDTSAEENLDVPAKVIEQIDTRLKELKDAQSAFDNGENAGSSIKQNAIDALERIKEHLSKKNIKDFNEAQVFYGTLWSEITHLLPSALINFLVTGRNNKSSFGNAAEAN